MQRTQAVAVNTAITNVNVVPFFPAGAIIGTAGDDTLQGTQRDDRIFGLEGDDVLIGNLGNDEIHDGLGYDDSFGNGGDDLFIATDEGDVSGFINLFDGGAGVDTISYQNSGFGWQIALKINLASNGSYFDTLLGIENVIGSQQADEISGTDQANVLEGLGGNDTIQGFGGDDTINGGAGQDYLNGGTGDDLLNGGTGSDWIIGADGVDTVTYTTEGAGVVVELGSVVVDPYDLSNNTGFATTSSGQDTLIKVENIIGSRYADVLTGLEHASSEIHGGAGADEIFGGQKDDLLRGNNGWDTIFGGRGGDTIYGGNGADVLHSGTGPNPTGHIIGPFDSHNNYLYGGNHDDTLFAQSVDYNFLSGGAGDDTLVYAPAHVQSFNFVGPPIYTPDVTMAGGSDADRFILNHYGLDQIDFVITDFNEAEDTLVFDNMRRDGGVFSRPEINDIGDLDTNGDNVISSADRDWSQTASGHLVLDLAYGDTLTLLNTNSIDINAIDIL